MLTEKEKKKIKRLRKLEKVKDIQEKMALGLIEPAKPKLRLSTFMNAISTMAVADPS